MALRKKLNINTELYEEYLTNYKTKSNAFLQEICKLGYIPEERWLAAYDILKERGFFVTMKLNNEDD